MDIMFGSIQYDDGEHHSCSFVGLVSSSSKYMLTKAMFTNVPSYNGMNMNSCTTLFWWTSSKVDRFKYRLFFLYRRSAINDIIKKKKMIKLLIVYDCFLDLLWMCPLYMCFVRSYVGTKKFFLLLRFLAPRFSFSVFCFFICYFLNGQIKQSYIHT